MSTERYQFKSVLKEMCGRVAISGYGDMYDDLGWERHEYDCLVRGAGRSSHKTVGTERTEVLWTNYVSTAQQTLF